MDPAIELIRHAITRGDYAQASDLWKSFACELEKRARLGRLSVSAWSEVTELFTWSRNVLFCVRAQALDSMNANHVANAYRQAR